MQRSKLIFSVICIFFSTFYISDSYGQWSQTFGINNNESTDNFAVIGNKIFVCDFSTAVYVSTNDGANWSVSLNYPGVTSIAVNGSNIYSGCWQYGLFRSSNSGSNWEQVSTGSLFIDALALNTSYIFAGMHYNIPNQYNLYRSSNNGTNWQVTPLNKYINCIKVNGDNIFAGTSSYGVYLSTNNGSNWTQTDLDSGNIGSIAFIGSNIYASVNNYPAGIGGIYLSSNNGSNWSRIFSDNSYGYNISAIGTTLFAGSANGIYVSTSSGLNWLQKNEGLSNPLPSIYNFLLSGNYVLVSTSKAVWRRPAGELIGIEQISSEVPSGYTLEQNYPNPFNPETKIKFSIKKAGSVSLKIYDILGKEISVSVNQALKPGIYEVPFNASNLSSGVYFYRLLTKDFTDTKKLMVVK